MGESQAPSSDSGSPPGLGRRLFDLGRRFLSRLFGRKKAKNPNIYPLY